MGKFRFQVRWHFAFFGIVLISIQGCAPNRNSVSHVSVINGAPISGTEFQSVVKILRYEENGERTICTGTFIDSFKVLTAAHCLGSATEPILDVEWSVDDSTTVQKQAKVIAVHPQFRNEGKRIHPNDLAILSIDSYGEPFPSPILLSTETLAIDSQVTMIGFGNNKEILQNSSITGTGAGTKRIGKNKVYTLTRSGLIIVSGNSDGCGLTESNSATGDGDSGGPLLINNQIIGITLGGGIIPAQSEDKCSKAISYFANLRSELNSAFITENLD
ncbi:MAG: trypsin-like serine protease [Pseudomonadota bacterium]|jgi:trypsin